MKPIIRSLVMVAIFNNQPCGNSTLASSSNLLCRTVCRQPAHSNSINMSTQHWHRALFAKQISTAFSRLQLLQAFTGLSKPLSSASLPRAAIAALFLAASCAKS